MITRTPWKQVAPVPSLIAPIPGACMCRVIDVANVDPPSQYGGANYADAITYTVDVDTPNGPIFGAVGVIPKTPRWPRPWLVVPFEATSNATTGDPTAVLPCMVLNGRVYLLVSEERYAAPCDGGA